ncbi:MAG: hypothetical protein Q9220_002198 [cf. Caloplaca sp. 1 TL-2023]
MAGIPLLQVFHRNAISGYFADRGSSRTRSFSFGLALLFASTLMFDLGKHPIMLVVARCLQGTSAGIVYTAGLALLIDTVGQHEIGRWIGFAFSGMSAGVMISPSIAGFIYARAGYHAVFATVLAILGLDFVMRLAVIEKQVAQEWIRDDEERGAFAKVTQDAYGTTGQDEAAKIGGVEAPTHTDVPTANAPSLPPPHRHATFFKETAILLKSRGILAAMYGGFIQTTLICAFDGILPLFVHKTFGWETSGGGTIFLALTIPSLAAPLVGTLSDRLGARMVVLAGMVLCTLTIALLALVHEDTVQHVVLLCGLLALTGVGVTMMLSPLAADLFDIVSRMAKEHDSAFGPKGPFAKVYGLFNSALALGIMLGPALAGFVYEKEGWRATVWALAALCASGIVPIVLFTGKG